MIDERPVDVRERIALRAPLHQEARARDTRLQEHRHAIHSLQAWTAHSDLDIGGARRMMAASFLYIHHAGGVL
jgi:hypothetical protein